MGCTQIELANSKIVASFLLLSSGLLDNTKRLAKSWGAGGWKGVAVLTEIHPSELEPGIEKKLLGWQPMISG